MDEAVQIPLSIVDRFERTLDDLGRKLDTIRQKQNRLHAEGERNAMRAGRSFDTARQKQGLMHTEGERGTMRSVRSFETLRNRQAATFNDGERGANRFARSFERATSRITSSGGMISRVGQSIGNEIRSVISLTARWGSISAAAGAGGVALLIRQGFKLNSDMDRYRVTLETMMKSQSRANGMIRWMFRFTEKTPFQITGMAEAVTQLQAFGLNAQRWLPVVGNMAAAFGGTDEKVQQAIRSISFLRSGRTGEAFESLTRLGISRADFVQEGSQFDKGGSLIGDPEDAMDALERIVNRRFPGLMDRISKTFAGTLSNLQDVGQNLLRDTTRGLFDDVASDARGLLDTLERMRSDGRMAGMRDSISGAMVDGFRQAKKFAREEIIDVFEARGLSGVFDNLFEKAKGPAADFLEWLARGMSQGIVGAVKLAFGDPELRKAALLWLGIRNAGTLAMGGLNTAMMFGPSVARGVGGILGRGGRGVSGAFRSFGVRRMAAAAGRSNTFTRTPTRLGSASGAGSLIGAPALSADAEFWRGMGGASSALSGGGGLSDIAMIAAASAAPGLLARGGSFARAGFGRLMARLAPGAVAPGVGAYLGVGGGAAASGGVASAITAPVVGAGAIAAYGTAAAADSIASAVNGTELAGWNIPGRSGLYYRSLFTDEGNPYATEPGHIARNRDFIDRRHSRMDPLVRAALQQQGPGEARRVKKLIPARSQLRDDVGAMGDEFLSLKDTITGFRDLSNSTIDEMATRLTNQGSGLIGGFETLEDRINRITTRSLPALRAESERIAARRGALSFDPSDPQAYAFDLEKLGRQGSRNLRSIYEERINREGLLFKQQQGTVAENQGFLNKFINARQNGGDVRGLLDLFAEGVSARKSGDGSKFGLDRLIEIQQGTGFDLSKMIRPLAEKEFKETLTRELGPTEAGYLMRNFGGFESSSSVFEKKLDELIAEFRLSAGKQAEELQASANVVGESIVGAFEDGAARAAERIAAQLGLSVPQAASEELNRIISAIVQQLASNGRDTAASQASQGFGEG